MATCRKCNKTFKYTHFRNERYCSFECHIKKNVLENENGCWLLNTQPRKDGYIQMTFRRMTGLAHRLSYMNYKGNIDDDLIVCHTCDNRNCINPDHLYLGTHSTNAIDRQNRNPRADQKGQNNHAAKLNECDVKNIRKEAKKELDLEKLAAKYGISHRYIKDVINGRRWSHVN